MSGSRVIGSLFNPAKQRVTVVYEPERGLHRGRLVWVNERGQTLAVLPERPVSFRAARAWVREEYQGEQFNYRDAAAEKRLERSRASKTRFVCLECNQHAWASPTAELVCGRCYAEDKRVREMVHIG